MNRKPNHRSRCTCPTCGTAWPTNLAPHLVLSDLPEAEFEQGLRDLKRRYALARAARKAAEVA